MKESDKFEYSQLSSNILQLYKSSSKLIIRSQDCYVYDQEGKKYIDFESGVWCSNLGHSHDNIIRLIDHQSRECIHHGYSFRNTQSEELSQELLELSGLKNGASVFLSSGSEAVNLSITLSRSITGRKKILRIDNSYLSAYGFGQVSDENDDLMNIKFNDQTSSKNINFREISAFVVETGSASYGIIKFPDPDFVKSLIEKSRENGCLIIAEEVTTGMGRTGKWFGFQHYDFIPDIVVTGKGLGNGYPVSAVTVNSDVLKRFNQKQFRYAQSHQNDPLGCAIGLEVIRTIKKGKLIEKGQHTGEFFQKQLEKLHNRFPDKIKEIR
ncbi:MAG: aminotransferase class III-fold pyridoxal phosphate-dependent enzyme, partial [Bacteroidota bacterium]